MTLTEALQLLTEGRTAMFMAKARPLASAVLTKKPWRHHYMETIKGPLRCERCKAPRTKDAAVAGCPVPPTLAGSPADIAFALRDLCMPVRLRETIRYFWLGYACPGRSSDDWWLMSNPEEQIAVCLEALGQFREEKL